MRILPVIKVGPKLYFVDERLHQYRSVVPHPEIIEFIEFGQEPWDKVEWANLAKASVTPVRK